MPEQVNNVSSEDSSVANVTTENTQNTQPSFLDSISDKEIRDSKSLADFKDVDGLAKSYISLEKKLGAPKELEIFAANQYNFESPEGYKSNNEIIDLVRDKAVQLGIKPDAFKTLIETFVNKEHEIITQHDETKKSQVKEFQDSLKKEWGQSYDDNLKLADTTWRSLAPESMDSVLENMSPNEQIAIAKIMVNIASKTSEETVGKQKGNNSLDKVSAQHKLENIMNNHDHPYHKGDVEAINEFFELQKATIDNI